MTEDSKTREIKERRHAEQKLLENDDRRTVALEAIAARLERMTHVIERLDGAIRNRR